jgi:histone H3/H4
MGDDRPMLYSAEAREAIYSIEDRIGRALTQHALDLAKRDGRNLITAADVWGAFDDIDVAGLFAHPDEKASG